MSSTTEPPGASGPGPASPVAQGPPAPADPLAGAENPASEPSVPVRPRRRTALIVAGAALLGVLAGTVTGYAVQYQRGPTPLGPLAQQGLAESRTAPADRTTTARGVSVNRWDEKSDGDLRRLLLAKPDAAKTETQPTWQDLLLASADYEHPDGAFARFLRDGFRRSATTTWSQGGKVYVTVTLTQFRDDTAVKSKDYARQQQKYLPEEAFAGNYGKPVPGSDNGRTYVFDKPHTEAGYEPLYEGRALAWRNGIFMEIQYNDNSGPVSEPALQALAKQQLERL
ncbi:hypothetical protein ACFYZ9_27100 [Streptomyces sp. NPDC001691]|uniref:hypothetical protein n=1 Tax=Streptomyces sp. NPDC001691 TaxID=3364600 RepID=UPI003692E1A2